MKTVFISRTANLKGPLRAFCAANQIQLIDQSLLTFKGVCPNEKPKETDVVFFTSPRSVRFYFSYFKYKNELLATIGTSTANELQKLGLSVDFTGTTPSHPEVVAQELKVWLGERTVLFPQSHRSNRTMQKVLNPNQYRDLVVYETNLEPIKLANRPNYLVLTSPSNAEAYMLSNKLENDQIVMSFGTTTSTYLEEKGVKNLCLSEPTEHAVVDALKKV